MSNIDKQACQVSRYDLVSGYMQKWPDGEFVYHSDYQALLDELEAAEKLIAELGVKLETADKLQDSAFRHGLQHGFSFGQTDNQAGFEECLSAYGTRSKDNG
ncbi:MULTISPECIES: hypothetical protein [Enterobacter]|uniref:hypothetical protein n=1 Tax=Enterobacter TaxID=547 RepID=UPI00208E5059|nr:MULTISPECIES: hypothetical protein [Enterobacter]HCM9626363.1 hypothetical protein [Enterobacter hormaechei subsp. hoffmannii]HCM9664446.1 hypothetical protein [Enterobacter hormaechei subsp. hoffmannii]